MHKRRTAYDPLACIPSSEVIEQRLKDAESEARRLRVLLATAKAIETERCADRLREEAPHHA